MAEKNQKKVSVTRAQYRKKHQNTKLVALVAVVIVVLIAAVAVIFGMKQQEKVGHTNDPEKTAQSSRPKAKKPKKVKVKKQKKPKAKRPAPIPASDSNSMATSTVAKNTQSQPSQSKADKSGSDYVTVEPGQGIFRVAYNAGTTEEKVWALNGMKPGSAIHPGQRLKVR